MFLAWKLVPKIVGGTEAAEGEFPYLASLRVYDYRNVLTHFCGSSIISHWFVLTAAHCMLDYPKDRIEVVVGTNDFWSGGAKYKIDKYINHENYNKTSFANDISLILVNRQIQLGEKGDSGGALVFNGTVHGITSWNIPCGKGKPDVFTRVYKYVNWISTTVGKLPIPT
ncbi:chymotrypsin-2-like [Pieris brassicae]|uniref:chymotrypsin-2-like n=1 Tax=Pieris brassicae TaxID=7116 RepID=UPI001E65FDF9|nr:chymotrypsin-2-like [Pieris brassicae]